MIALEGTWHWVAPLLASLAVLLVALVAARGILPIFTFSPAKREARARMSAAATRAKDAESSLEERASALLVAGREARELGDRRAAFRFARAAHELAPGDPEVIAFAVATMQWVRRSVVLERMLWQSLDRAADDAAFERARDALVTLYRGALLRPERARVLEGMTRNVGDRANVA